MDMRNPPLKLTTLLESNLLKSRILVRRLAVFVDSEYKCHVHGEESGQLDLPIDAYVWLPSIMVCHVIVCHSKPSRLKSSQDSAGYDGGRHSELGQQTRRWTVSPAVFIGVKKPLSVGASRSGSSRTLSTVRRTFVTPDPLNSLVPAGPLVSRAGRAGEGTVKNC